MGIKTEWMSKIFEKKTKNMKSSRRSGCCCSYSYYFAGVSHVMWRMSYTT